MRYHNPHVGNIKRRLVDVLLWKMGYWGHAEHLKPPPDGFTYPRPKKKNGKTGPKATWIGHCTFLVQVDGINILTDPVFGKRVSPVPFVGPVRRHAPGVALDKMPKIDCVLISHNHYDHLEKETVLALNRKYPNILWMVPTGVAKWFKKLGIKNIQELSWWKSHKWKNIEFTAVPTQHFSGRSPLDNNRSLWVGWVVKFGKSGKQLYFCGDTGYNRVDFKKIGKKFGKMDLSLIPIGTYEPMPFMKPVHVDPKCAVKIHKDVHSALSLGMHWKTYRLSDEPLDRPPYDLYRAMTKAHLDPTTFLAVEPGEQINW